MRLSSFPASPLPASSYTPLSGMAALGEADAAAMVFRLVDTPAAEQNMVFFADVEGLTKEIAEAKKAWRGKGPSSRRFYNTLMTAAIRGDMAFMAQRAAALVGGEFRVTKEMKKLILNVNAPNMAALMLAHDPDLFNDMTAERVSNMYAIGQNVMMMLAYENFRPATPEGEAEKAKMTRLIEASVLSPHPKHIWEETKKAAAVSGFYADQMWRYPPASVNGQEIETLKGWLRFSTVGDHHEEFAYWMLRLFGSPAGVVMTWDRLRHVMPGDATVEAPRVLLDRFLRCATQGQGPAAHMRICREAFADPGLVTATRRLGAALFDYRPGREFPTFAAFGLVPGARPSFAAPSSPARPAP